MFFKADMRTVTVADSAPSHPPSVSPSIKTANAAIYTSAVMMSRTLKVLSVRTPHFVEEH